MALSPNAFTHYESLFNLFNLPYTVVEENIQRFLDIEENSMKRNMLSRNVIGKYARYTEVVFIK